MQFTSLSVNPWLLAMPCVVFASAAAAAPQDAPAEQAGRPADPSAAAGTDGDIVVTATRRAERLLDIPQAVTALDARTLEANGVRNFADYARLVPGLAFSDLGTGRPKPSLRGVNVNTGAATVGYYIDDTPIPSSTGSVRLTTIDPRLFDVQRVEVLRGPQGTLFGAGSMGGTIRIITNQPNPDALQGAIRLTGDLTAHGGFGEAADAMVNLPITDGVALRVVGWARTSDGFIDRKVNGVKVARVPYQDTAGIRAALGVERGPLKLRASVFHETQQFSGFQTVTYGVGNPGRRLEQDLRFDIAEPNANRFTLLNLTGDLDLGPATLQSSTSYYDGGLSASEETAELLAAFFGPTFSNSALEGFTKKSFTQEVRLISKERLAGFNYTLGSFYSNVRTFRTFDLITPEYVPVVGTDILFVGRYRTNDKQLGFFGELSFEPVRNVELTVGGRYYDISIVDNGHSEGVFVGPDPLDTLTTFKKTGFVKKVSASYKPGRNVQLYAQASEGFRPGFGTTPLPNVCNADIAALGIDPNKLQVDPDSVWNYEVGAKAASAGGKVRGAIAAYRIDWSKIQLGVFLPCGYRYNSNAGDARIEGLEMEGAATLADGFEIGGSLSYTHTKFTSIAPGAGASVGDPILEVPEWQGGGYAQYTAPLGGTLTGTLRVDAQYTGPALLFYDTDAATAPAPLEFRRRPDVTLLNTRFEIRQGNWSVALFGRNLLDQVKVAGFGDSLSANISYRPRFAVNQPRTVGVELNHRF